MHRGWTGHGLGEHLQSRVPPLPCTRSSTSQKKAGGISKVTGGKVKPERLGGTACWQRRKNEVQSLPPLSSSTFHNQYAHCFREMSFSLEIFAAISTRKCGCPSSTGGYLSACEQHFCFLLVKQSSSLLITCFHGKRLVALSFYFYP